MTQILPTWVGKGGKGGGQTDSLMQVSGRFPVLLVRVLTCTTLGETLRTNVTFSPACTTKSGGDCNKYSANQYTAATPVQ